jgi:hypothetical protein
LTLRQAQGEGICRGAGGDFPHQGAVLGDNVGQHHDPRHYRGTLTNIRPPDAVPFYTGRTAADGEKG